jgi:DNA modification methylase
MADDLDSRFHIYQHDSRELKSRLEEEFDNVDGLVDTIITSPPYADLVDYGDHDEQVGKQSYEDFLDDIHEIYKQCYEIASDDCTLWIVTDTYKIDGRVVRLPFDIADELENLPNYETCLDEDCEGCLRRNRGDGTLICKRCGEVYDPLPESWRMEDNIIWDKLRTRPWHQKGRLRNVHEHVTMFSKTDDFKYDKDAIRITDTDEFEQWWVNYPERYSPRGMVPSNVWKFPIPKQGQWGPKVSYHPSPFPEGLVERIVHLASEPGDVVFDPFAGIGTTLAIAEALDRKPLGFELNEEYIEYYEEHVRPTALHEVGTVQSTLRDEQVELELKIYTLRIHKYAYELYKEFVNSDQHNILEGQIEFIHTASDPSQFGDGDDPEAELLYVCESESDYESVDVEAARKGMLSEDKGSGDYYGVEFDADFITVDRYLDERLPGRDVNIEDEYHLYVDGAHNWAEHSFTPEDWEALVEEREWKRYWSKSRPPLISNLLIQAENPMDERKRDIEGHQADFSSFN